MPTTSLLVLLFATASPVPADGASLPSQRVVFVHELPAGKKARELARVGGRELLSAGRRPEAAGDFTWQLEVRQVRDSKALRVSFETAYLASEVRADVTIEGGIVRDSRGAEVLRVEPGTPVFPYDDRVASTLLHPARELCDRARTGRLRVGDPIALVDLLARSRRDYAVVRYEEIADARRTWWRIELEGGDRDLHLVCDETGLVARVYSRATRTDVVRMGAEEAPPACVRSFEVDDGPWKELLSKPRHDVIAERGVRIPMRDGTILVADVYRPDTEERVPTILVRTPYLRVTEVFVNRNTYVPRGYALVAQDVRGRGDSEGEFDPLRHEMDDGSDTLDWIAAQPWSDGSVGMIGSSYVGWVQWFAAKSRNPHLKAIVPIVSPPDPDENFPWEGGVPMLLVGWWAAVLDAMDSDGPGAMPSLDWEDALSRLPLSEIDEGCETTRPWVDLWLTTPPSDPYWDACRYQNAVEHLEVAALNISGWFDGDQPGAPMNFRLMRDRAPPSVRAHPYLVMGPWGHGVNVTRRLGDVDFGDDAVIDLDAICIRFFDRYLKGVRNGIDEEDPVLYFTMGENRWHRVADWPPPGTTRVPLFLRGDGRAHYRDGDGRLSTDPPVRPDAREDVYLYDPMDLPPFDPDLFNDVVGASATMDCSILEDRSDVLDYRSPPLLEDVVLTGPFSVSLAVRTDAADTDFACALYRVEPDGAMRRIAGGIQRLRYRLSPVVDRPVPRGDVVRVDIDAWASSVRLFRGDRLHLEIGSTAWPAMARNLNTLQPLESARSSVVAENRVYHDGVRASFVSLPVEEGSRVRFR